MALPVLTIAAQSANKAEGNGGTTPFTFLVTRSGDLSGYSDVMWAQTSYNPDPLGASTNYLDFTGPTTGTLYWAPGEISKTITLNVVGDTLFEQPEAFTVTFLAGSAHGATVGGSSFGAVGTIQNDDFTPLPVLSITADSPANRNEGSSGGLTPYTFTVSHTGSTANASSVRWETGVTGVSASVAHATYGGDFVGGDGLLTWAVGDSSDRTITVNVIADTVLEQTEFFSVSLTQWTVAGATLANPAFYAVVGIVNDDNTTPDLDAHTLGLSSTALVAGGSTTVSYSVSNQTLAVGTTTAGIFRSTDAVFDATDIQLATRTTPGLAAGQTTTDSVALTLSTVGSYYIIAVADINQAVAESNETNNPSNAVLVNVTAPTVLPDLDAWALTLSATALVAGSSTTVDYFVDNRFANAPASTVGIYRSANNVFDASDVLLTTRSTPALGNGSFVNDSFALTLSTVGSYYIIAVADYNKTITEQDETNNPSLAVLVNVAALPLPVLSISPLSANKAEGNGFGGTPFTFTVTRTGDLSGTSSATWQLREGATFTVDGNDFLAGSNGNGTVIFAPGQTTATITTLVYGDNLIEGAENFRVTLDSATGATINPLLNIADGHIVDDDFADLTPTSLSLIGSTLYYVIANIGSVAPVSSTGIYLSSDSIIHNDPDFLLTSRTTPALAAGANHFDGVSLVFPGGLMAGAYYIGVYADAPFLLTESNETNNAASIRVIFGDANGNTLIGTPGGDNMCGWAGNDRLTGFLGADYLVGGIGIDIFIYESFAWADARLGLPVFDYVIDYNQGNSGTYVFAEGDQIDLSALLSAAYNHGSGQSVASLVHAVASGTGVNLQIDIDGILNGTNWTTIARLEGVRTGNSVNVILDATLPAGTTIVVSRAIGDDFNSDSRSDILMQNVRTGECYIWEMSGISLVGNGAAGWATGAVWQAKADGDYNGDGRSDILLQNASTGACYIWELNGTSLVGSGAIGWTPGAEWQARDDGDFNGDGRSDILLQNANTGDCYIWELNGTSLVGNGAVGWTPGAAWQAKDGGDFNGDGNSDILLQNVNTGDSYMWLMDGTSLIGHGPAGWSPGPDWCVL